MSFYRWNGPNLVLKVKVQSRARNDEIIGLHGDRLKIRIKAPPINGKANQYLCNFIARLCKLPKQQVKVIAGEQNSLKILCIDKADTLPAEIIRALFI